MPRIFSVLSASKPSSNVSATTFVSSSPWATTGAGLISEGALGQPSASPSGGGGGDDGLVGPGVALGPSLAGGAAVGAGVALAVATGAGGAEATALAIAPGSGDAAKTVGTGPAPAATLTAARK